MRLVIVGPGVMPIPPRGWGAVESLIWDYKVFLDKYHPDIETIIVNERDTNDMITKVNSLNPDIIHIQYDELAKYYTFFNCKKVLLTSHYGYLDQLQDLINRGDTHYFHHVFRDFIKTRCYLLALSPSIADVYKNAGYPEQLVYVQPNGANDEIFRYSEQPRFADRSLYLAKIDMRKRQVHYQGIESLWFAGNITDSGFNAQNPRYLGEWTKEYLYDNLTDYGNLVLLSDGEAHPLVCCEALVCGLGLVISEYATANLDLSLPFIKVIPKDKLNDIPYITQAIQENRRASFILRKQIREYGVKTFSWKVAVEKYAAFLRNVLINNR